MRALLVVVLLAPLLVQAQTPEQDPAFEVVADETVVTAGRLPAPASRTGRALTVISAREIAQSSAQSLDELLRFEAGVQVTPRSAFGAQADISLRGGTFNGVVILIDGARFNGPQTGHFLSDFPIPLAEIARIEVVRGPDAAAWGPDALGGVIHIITHVGVATVAPASGIGLAAGSLGTVILDYNGGSPSSKPVQWSVASSTIRTDGARALDADGEQIVGSEGDVRADLDRVAVTGALGTRFSNARLTARVALDAREFGAMQFYTPLASDTSREATSTLWAQARLSSDLEAATSWAVQAAARRHTDWFTFFPGLDPNRHTSTRIGVTAEATRAATSRLTVGGGVSGEARGVESNSLGNHDDVSGGVFALARWTPGRLSLSGSARVDADPVFGLEAAPMLAAAWAGPGVTLRAAGGRAVRAPNYTERYLNTTRELRSGNMGNPDLRSERAWSGEIGLDWRPASSLAVGVTAFARRTDDLIDYARTVLEGVEVFLAQNVLATDARGLEVTAQTAVRLGASRLRLRGGYAWTDVEVDPGAFASGDFRYVLDHSPHLLQARVALEAGPATLVLEGLHKTRVEDAAVTLGHARLMLAPPSMPGVATLEVRNVFDAQYTEVFGAPMPGRVWLAGIRLAFGRRSDLEAVE